MRPVSLEACFREYHETAPGKPVFCKTVSEVSFVKQFHETGPEVTFVTVF